MQISPRLVSLVDRLIVERYCKRELRECSPRVFERDEKPLNRVDRKPLLECDSVSSRRLSNIYERSFRSKGRSTEERHFIFYF